MTGLINKLAEKWAGTDDPFLISSIGNLKFSDIKSVPIEGIDKIKSGDVVALIGDFDPISISLLLQLLDRKVILVPLTEETRLQHQYFFENALVDTVIEGGTVRKIHPKREHSLVEKLRLKGHAGIVLFSTGTTGRPKAILHDFTSFLKRFETPSPTLRTINFLLFDHIGGLNTLFHTLFNKGIIIAPDSRDVSDILRACRENEVEVLPTTPTFLRMMLISGLIPSQIPKSLRIITYGTERMDQPTLDRLCELLPEIDFRQTFGMSELGIVRVKSRGRDSLFMKIGGEGVETRIKKNVLEIKSKNRMVGYLNAPSPFDEDGWYNTNDIVEVKDGYFKITGRTSEVINVGGLKFMASEIERVALEFEDVALAKAVGKSNPITGQHIELTVQPKSDLVIDKSTLKAFLSSRLPRHMVPKRLRVKNVEIGHRYKRV